MLRLHFVFAFLAVASVLAAGCGGSEQSGDATPTAAATTAPATTAPATTAAEEPTKTEEAPAQAGEPEATQPETSAGDESGPFPVQALFDRLDPLGATPLSGGEASAVFEIGDPAGQQAYLAVISGMADRADPASEAVDASAFAAPDSGADLAAWLQEHPRLKAGEAEEVQVENAEGIAFDLAPKKDAAYTSPFCTGGPCVVLFGSGSYDGLLQQQGDPAYFLADDRRGRVYIFEKNGESFAVIVDAAPDELAAKAKMVEGEHLPAMARLLGWS